MTPQTDSSLLYAALEAAANGVVITDASGVIEWTNPACCQLTGYTLDELMGEHTRLLKSGRQSEDFYHDLWHTVRAGRVWRGELINRRKDGSEYLEAMTITPVRDAWGAITHYVAVKEDITRRREAEAALREDEEVNRVTFEQAALGIAHVSPDGRYLRVNAAFCGITGRSNEELLGLTVGAVTHPDDLAANLDYVQRVLSGELTTCTFEKRYVRPDGSVVPAMLTVTLTRTEFDAPRFFISIVRDISEERERDLRMQRSQRLESLGTLASSIAHDLNNALAPILMSLELLKDGGRPEDAGLVETLEGSVTRASGMARQLLSFARGSDGQRMPLQPTHLIKEMQRLITSTFPANVHLDVSRTGTLPIILGDATQLHQVLLNLCVNARDAMPHGGNLTIDATDCVVDDVFAATIPDATPGRYVVLTVRDTGTGIPAHVLERIFEPFFTTKDPNQGTGLGLATALGIVKGHQGFMTVNTNPGRGSAFSVYLPVESCLTLPEAADANPVDFRGQGERVLLVDDDAPLREVGATVLRRLNLEPLAAADGIEGLLSALEARDSLQAALIDLFMPHMDGLALARALRRALPHLRIGAVSGRFEESVRTELHELGVTSLLEKPFSEHQLAATMRELLHPCGRSAA